MKAQRDWSLICRLCLVEFIRLSLILGAFVFVGYVLPQQSWQVIVLAYALGVVIAYRWIPRAMRYLKDNAAHANYMGNSDTAIILLWPAFLLFSIAPNLAEIGMKKALDIPQGTVG